MAEAVQDNQEQIDYWNGPDSGKWVRNQQGMDRMLSPFSDHVMDVADIQLGMKILDIGCGCGSTTAELARRAGAAGHVTGVDVSAPMLEIARQTASADNITYLEADASAMAPGQGFDLLFSRFGVMFFADATAAFTSLAATLRPGGRLAFACWQPLSENHWMLKPVLAAKEHIEMPPRAAPDAPGPFSFADPERVRSVLSAAGFQDIELGSFSQNMKMGDTLDDALQAALEVGPVGSALKNAEPAAQEKTKDAVRQALSPFETESGIFLPGKIWCVTAGQ